MQVIRVTCGVGLGIAHSLLSTICLLDPFLVCRGLSLVRGAWAGVSWVLDSCPTP